MASANAQNRRGNARWRLSFDLILSSPYLRAKQTAEIVGRVFEQKKMLRLSAALGSAGAAGKAHRRIECPPWQMRQRLLGGA